MTERGKKRRKNTRRNQRFDTRKEGRKEGRKEARKEIKLCEGGYTKLRKQDRTKEREIVRTQNIK